MTCLLSTIRTLTNRWRCPKYSAMTVLFVLTASTVLGQTRRPNRLTERPQEVVDEWSVGQATSPDGREHHFIGDMERLPGVTDVAISADGRRLVACYYIHAMNRLGTDWGAFAACWDLTTGRRRIITNALGRLAIAPDGGKFMIGNTLWSWGDERIERLTTPELPANSVSAWAFANDGNELLGVDADFRLTIWNLETSVRHDVPPPDLGEIKPLDQGLINLHVLGNEASMLASIRTEATSASEGAIRTTALSLRWIRNADTWGSPSMQTLNRSQSSLSFVNRAPGVKDVACDYGLSYEVESALIEALDHTDRRCYYGGPSRSSRLALAPGGRRLAYVPRGTRLARVNLGGGAGLREFSAVAVHAFTPDGTQLIVSEKDGTLRFYDVESGRIARSLRPDRRPADTVCVAAIQAPSEFGDPETNRRNLAQKIEWAAHRGAMIVVLPETAVTGYADYELKRVWQVDGRALSEPCLTGVDPSQAAETVPGPSTHFFADIARCYGIYLSVPLLEVDRKTGRYYNTVVLLGPDGRILIHYRKLNPWPWAEQGWASEGNLGHPIADTPFGRLGVLVCFDIHEQAARLADLKVDTLLYSIAWVDDEGSDWFDRRLPEIARNNHLNIVGANWTLPSGQPAPAWHGYGQSEIIDARGEVLSKAQRDIGETVVIAFVPIPVFGEEIAAKK